MTNARRIFHFEHGTGAVDWFEESGVVRVLRVVLPDGTVTEHPHAPDLGTCLDTGMPRALWQALLSAWERERENRRGTRWSCHTTPSPGPATSDRAIGLLHLGMTDRILADQNTIERLARWHHYHLTRILTIDHDTYMPTTLIIGTAAQHRASVVITPDLNHHGTTYKAVPRSCAILLPTGLIPADS